MKVNVIKYDHFVSFELVDKNGVLIIIQYRDIQVWQVDGVWQIGENEQPFYTHRFASTLDPEPKLSDDMWRALEAATKSGAHSAPHPDTPENSAPPNEAPGKRRP